MTRPAGVPLPVVGELWGDAAQARRPNTKTSAGRAGELAREDRPLAAYGSRGACRIVEQRLESVQQGPGVDEGAGPVLSGLELADLDADEFV